MILKVTQVPATKVTSDFLYKEHEVMFGPPIFHPSQLTPAEYKSFS